MTYAIYNNRVGILAIWPDTVYNSACECAEDLNKKLPKFQRKHHEFKCAKISNALEYLLTHGVGVSFLEDCENRLHAFPREHGAPVAIRHHETGVWLSDLEW